MSFENPLTYKMFKMYVLTLFESATYILSYVKLLNNFPVGIKLYFVEIHKYHYLKNLS